MFLHVHSTTYNVCSYFIAFPFAYRVIRHFLLEILEMFSKIENFISNYKRNIYKVRIMSKNCRVSIFSEKVSNNCWRFVKQFSENR